MFSTISLLCTGIMGLLCLIAGDRRMRRGVDRVLEAARIPRGGALSERGWLLPALLLVLGLLLRLGQMVRMRDAALPAEIWTLLEARSLWQTGRGAQGLPFYAPLPGPGGAPTGPLLVWLTAPLLPLLGESLWAVRLPMLLLQMLGMAALGDLVRRAFSRSAACWALLLLAVSPWQLMQSGWSLAWQTYPHVLLLGVWAFSRKAGCPVWSLLGTALFALSLYACDTAAYVTPVVFVAVLLVAWRRGRLALPWVGLCALVFAALGWTAFAQAGGYAQRLLWRVPTLVGEGYGSYPDMPPITEYGLQVLPLWRNDAAFAGVFTNLYHALIRLLNASVLQYDQGLEDTAAFFVGRYGFLYLFSIPLTLLGCLRLVIRVAQKITASRSEKGVSGDPGGAIRLMLLALCFGSFPFLLLHAGLEMRHYAVLFYPLVLSTAAGAAWVARRVRLSGLVMALLYGVGLLTFLLRGVPLDAAVPVQEAAPPPESAVVAVEPFPAKEQQTWRIVFANASANASALEDQGKSEGATK